MRFHEIRRAFRIPRFTRRYIEREVDDELAFHLEKRAEKLRASGMSADDAHAEAVRRFGALSSVRNECLRVEQYEHRKETIVTFIDHLRGDLKFTFRSLRRAPGFFGVALATLVLGIASVTAIFSFVYSVYYRPLPFKDASRIVAIEEHQPRSYHNWTVSPDAARAIRDGSRSFERVALFTENLTTTRFGEKPVQLSTLNVDSSFAPMFDLHPERGRLLTNQEITSISPVVVISDALWQSSFGGDPGIIGKTIHVGEEQLTVVGVMPPGFRFPKRTDLWRPLHLATDGAANDESVTALGKLRPGATIQTTTSELSTMARNLARGDRAHFKDMTLVIRDEMLDRQAGQVFPRPYLFVGAAMLLLLIACSNVANLFLVRGAERRGEMAVRASLGAGRGRLIMQSLTEAFVISTLAGVAGALLSLAFVKFALTLLPTSGFPSWLVFGLDSRVLLFVVGLVALVTIAVGLAPAKESTRFDLVRALKASGDQGVAGGGGTTKSARRAIIIQLSLSVVLFVGASLFVQSYRHLAVLDVGYPAEQIVSLQPSFGGARYQTAAGRMEFLNAVAGRAEALPGVIGTAIRGPLDVTSIAESVQGAEPAARTSTRAVSDDRLFVDGDTMRSRSAGVAIWPRPRYYAVSDSYFRTLGLHVLRGRTFANDDADGSVLVAVVSKQMATMLWPTENAIGRLLQLGATGRRAIVIGVVDDVRDLQGGSRGFSASPRTDAYFSLRQSSMFNEELLIHGAGDILALRLAAEGMARQADPDQLVTTFTLAHNLEISETVTRVFGSLIGLFAIAGLVLSIIGVYGVVAYGIAQRTREIGIRIALGGTSERVLRLILWQSMRFVATGLVVGFALSLGAGRLMKVLLFGVSPTEPITYAVACVTFAAVALLACYLPARRVAHVDPLTALRAD